jgi:hypothetical protein
MHQSNVQETNVYSETKERFAEPGTCVEFATEASVRDLAEGGERRFNDDGAEAGFRW